VARYYSVPEGVEARLEEELRRGGLDVVFLGELHERSWIVSEAAGAVRELCRLGLLGFLGLEHFNVEQQRLLDEWTRGGLTWEELVEEYRGGPEGFNLNIYRPLLEEAASCGARLVALMPPRTLARVVSREGRVPWLPEGAPDPASFTLYAPYRNLVSSLFPRVGPMAGIPVERLLLAQSYKDSVAAWAVARALAHHGPGAVLMGWVHVEPRGAVATRVRLLTGARPLVVGYREAGYEETMRWYRQWAGDVETRLVGLPA